MGDVGENRASFQKPLSLWASGPRPQSEENLEIEKGLEYHTETLAFLFEARGLWGR